MTTGEISRPTRAVLRGARYFTGNKSFFCLERIIQWPWVQSGAAYANHSDSHIHVNDNRSQNIILAFFRSHSGTDSSHGGCRFAAQSNADVRPPPSATS